MYRAATWLALDRGIDPADCMALTAALNVANIEISAVNGHGHFVVNATDAETVASLPDVSKNVSTVARCAGVRTLLVEYQRGFARIADVVMEGRDIGSVIFPETPWKYFIDAAPEVREHRRRQEGVWDSIRERDLLDSTRSVSPLRVAEGALRIDTTHLSIDEVVDAVCRNLAERGFEKLPANRE
jgi:cytidylate kinase